MMCLLAGVAPRLHRLWLTLHFTEPYARAHGYRHHESALNFLFPRAEKR
jgi:hypothetical protein